MCQALTELLADEREEGREEGLLLAKKIYKLHREGKSNKEITKMCNVSIEQVEEILE